MPLKHNKRQNFKRLVMAFTLIPGGIIGALSSFKFAFLYFLVAVSPSILLLLFMRSTYLELKSMPTDGYNVNQ